MSQWVGFFAKEHQRYRVFIVLTWHAICRIPWGFFKLLFGLLDCCVGAVKVPRLRDESLDEKRESSAVITADLGTCVVNTAIEAAWNHSEQEKGLICLQFAPASCE
ncbi:hypothetical protein Ae201684P_019555 [Aphanomyces euteiches]|uniref:Uncharacterized protein n=1 Tax=Aphanomyces euteiches TaxID=100861 RepID=A0A6G0WIW4_9STRA|nr:hypothetical protein Ae201684_014773 [Aphanomyces euteiches]KAH9078470.1 hypothetical protein Ae201684P_019555 [Aphanomyces euteiches]KAH9143144.1 hypothetical protein AeRB84_012835 [Aphanomyces euteiches]